MNTIVISSALHSYGPCEGAFTLNVDCIALHRGHFHALMGRSGSGKTTLLRVLMGFCGSVNFAPHKPTTTAVLHGQMAFKWLTIGEMVAWEERARLRAVDRRALLDVLRTFGLSALVLEKRPWEISQGMRQRFEIAKAVAFEPDLVLMDEAFSGIDAGIKHNVFEYLSRTAALGKAFLFVTHDIGDVMRLADTILIIDNGRIVGKVVPVESRAERLRMAPADLIELDSAKAIATQLF